MRGAGVKLKVGFLGSQRYLLTSYNASMRSTDDASRKLGGAGVGVSSASQRYTG